MAGPLGIALLTSAAAMAGTFFSGRQAKREAEKNREFQERMSNTSYQRGVADMRSAGINPALAAGRGGASTPSGAVAEVPDYGEATGRAVSSGLAVRESRARVELLEAQAEQARSGGQLSRTQAYDLSTSASLRYGLLAAQQAVANADATQRRELLPMILERARAEVDTMVSSARATNARAALDELAREGAGNIEDFERRMGEAGPWTRLLFELLRIVK